MTTIPEQKTKESVPEFKFHHLHMYCDELKSTEEYKKMEQHLNNFHKACPYKEKGMDLENGRKIWGELTGKAVDASAYIPQGQDLVTQLPHGVGWRVTGEYGGVTILHVRYACGRTTSVECNLYFPVKIRLAKLPQKNRRCPSLMIISCNHTSMSFTSSWG